MRTPCIVVMVLIRPVNVKRVVPVYHSLYATVAYPATVYHSLYATVAKWLNSSDVGIGQSPSIEGVGRVCSSDPAATNLHNLQAGEAVSAASLPVRAVSVHCEAMLSSRGL